MGVFLFVRCGVYLSMMTQDDADLILSYKNGNEIALKELIEKYTSSIHNFVARIAGREHAADIVQDTFIKVWKNIHKFNESKASFKTWIFLIARNTSTDVLRKKKFLNFSTIDNYLNKEEDSFTNTIPDTGLLPMELIQKMQDSDILNAALATLQEKYRSVLILHYQEEMTFDEIGKILNIPTNTVKSQHRRAILALRTILERTKE